LTALDSVVLLSALQVSFGGSPMGKSVYGSGTTSADSHGPLDVDAWGSRPSQIKGGTSIHLALLRSSDDDPASRFRLVSFVVTCSADGQN
jgi:hypothetical protein